MSADKQAEPVIAAGDGHENEKDKEFHWNEQYILFMLLERKHEKFILLWELRGFFFHKPLACIKLLSSLVQTVSATL